ncbi:MAG: hypothetical protein IT262_08080 [Saprospiraceae bacterium]|nr:hypothetical protein [Saprospiraceae bacterium]
MKYPMQSFRLFIACCTLLTGCDLERIEPGNIVGGGPVTKFEKTFDDWGAGRRVRQLSDGGYMIAGTRYDASFKSDVFLVRTDANGLTTSGFERAYSDSDADIAEDVIQLSDGTFVIVGSTYNAAAGNSDVFYLRTKANGDPLTGPVRLGFNNSNDVGLGVEELTDGNILITGYSINPSTGSSEVYLAKKSPDLAVNFFELRVPGADEEVGFDVVQLTDGYAVAGQVSSSGGTLNALYLKTDLNGVKLAGFPKTFGGSSDENAYSIVKTASNQLVLCGTTFSQGGGDAYLIKVDENGNAVSPFPLGIGDAQLERGYELSLASDGGFVIAGQKNMDAWFVKTDANGTVRLNKSFVLNGDQAFWSGRQTTDGGYIMVGEKSGILYMVKTDKDGNVN